jgi:hypothetical protein
VMACAKVNFRFMGLWDTVLSTDFSTFTAENGRPSKYDYQLAIPNAFKYVAHAVALNEYRSAPQGVNAVLSGGLGNTSYWDSNRPHLVDNGHYGGFPLQSIGRSSTAPGKIRVELGFIGAHADVGGGYGTLDSGLSTVALSWMMKQAELSGVAAFRSNPPINMGNPVVHDQSGAMRWGSARLAESDGWRVEDRHVEGAFAGGTGRTMGFNFGEGTPTNRSLTNRDIENQRLINYATRDGSGYVNFTQRSNGQVRAIEALNNVTGNVNMTEYMKWLREHGYQFYGD